MLIVSNWKAYVADAKKAKALVAVAKRLGGKGEVKLVIAPPAPYLGLFLDGTAKKSANLSFGAQDVSLSTGGAATGEITAAALAGLGVTHVVVGHSERRAMGETDDTVLTKVQHALAQGMTPILCIGERERDAEAKYLNLLRAQIAHTFEPLSMKDRSRLIIAYEPIWAIGKSAADSIQPQDLQEMVLYIRKILSNYVSNGGKDILILYGGSVEPANARDLAAGGEVDGVLVGHASADVAAYTALVKALA